MLTEFLISLLICSFVIGIAYIAFWQSLKWKRAAKTQNKAIKWPNTAIRISGGIFEGAIIALLPSIIVIADHFRLASLHHVQWFSVAHSRPIGCGTGSSGRMPSLSLDGPEDLPKVTPCQGAPGKLEDETVPVADKEKHQWNLGLIESGIQK